jgi:hypothetical protein
MEYKPTTLTVCCFEGGPGLVPWGGPIGGGGQQAGTLGGGVWEVLQVQRLVQAAEDGQQHLRGVVHLLLEREYGTCLLGPPLKGRH